MTLINQKIFSVSNTENEDFPKIVTLPTKTGYQLVQQN